MPFPLLPSASSVYIVTSAGGGSGPPITGTPDTTLTGKTTFNLTVPAGVTSSMTALIWMNGSTTTPTTITASKTGAVFSYYTSGTGWSGASANSLAGSPVTTTNSFYAVWKATGLTAGDTVVLTCSPNATLADAMHVYLYNDLPTAGAFTVKSATTTTAAAITTTAGQKCYVVSLSRAGVGVTRSSISNSLGFTTTNDYALVDGTTAPACISHVDEFVATGTSSGVTTETYSQSNTNGGAVTFAEAPASGGGSPTDGAAISVTETSSVRVVGALTSAVPGGVGTTTAKVRLDAPGATSGTVKAATNTGLTTGVVTSGTVTFDSDGLGIATLTGLTPGTDYFFGATIDTVPNAQRGNFRTAVSGGYSYSFATASCLDNTADPTVLNSIRTRTGAAGGTAEFFAMLGDIHYHGRTSSSQSVILTDFRDVVARTNAGALFAAMPWEYTWSDHDLGIDNCDSVDLGSACINANRAVFGRYFPTYDLPAVNTDGAPYRSWVRGRVRFVMTDGRTYMSDIAATDNSSKTKWGATQKQWVKDESLAAAANGQVLVILNEDGGWTSTGPFTGDDSWAAYTTERQEMFNYWTSIGMNTNMMIIHGDYHNLGVDDGSHNSAGIPIILAAPLHQTYTLPSQTQWSGGHYPLTDPGVAEHQYGWFDVTDSGSGTVTIAFTGYSNDNTGGTSADTSRLTFSKTFSPGTVATTDTSAVSVAETSSVGNMDTITQTGFAAANPGSVTGANATSLNFSLSGMADGHMMFVFGVLSDAQTGAISAPAGWTILDQFAEGTTGGASSRAIIMWRVKQPGDTSVTINWSVSCRYQFTASAWTGVHLTNPATAPSWRAHTSGTTYTTGTQTAPNINAWSVAAFFSRGTTATTGFGTGDPALVMLDSQETTSNPFTGLMTEDSDTSGLTGAHSYTTTGQSSSHGSAVVFYLLPADKGFSTPISGTEAPAVSVADVSNTIVGSSTSTDTSAVSVAETRSIAGSSTSTDTSAVSVAETSSVAVTQPTTDTSAISVSETSAVTVTISTTDTSAVSVADVSQTIASSLSRTDTSAVSVADVSTSSITESRTDTSAISVAETSSVAVTQSTTDTSAISVAESVATQNNFNTTDTSAVSVADTSSSALSLSRTDTSAVSVADVSTSSSTLSTTDTSAISVADVSNTIPALASTTDTSAVSVAESSSLVITNAISTTDTSAVSVAETSQPFVTLSRTDTSAVSVSDVTNQDLVSFNTTDTSAVSVSESSSLSIFNVITSTDTAAVSVADASNTIVGSSTSTETSSISVAETSASSGTMSSTDTAAISVSETSDAGIFALKSATDTAAVSVADSSTSSSTLSSTDTVAVAVTDIGSLADSTPGSDAAAISVVESATVFVTSSRSDSSAVSVSDASSTVQLSIFTSTDTSALSVAETSTLFKQITSTDDILLSVAETSSIADSETHTDTIALSVAETSSLFVTVSRTDTSAVSATSVVTLSAFISATDTSALSVSDVSTSSSTLSASDTTAVSVNDTSILTVIVHVTDDSTISVDDTGTVDIRTAPLLKPKVYVNGQWKTFKFKVYINGQWTTPTVYYRYLGIWS